MAEQIYKFKIIPQQERFYNNESNWGVYNFTTEDEIPEYYDCYDNDGFNDSIDNSEPKKYKGSSLVGKMQRLTIGVEYDVQATCEYNKKYKQYQYAPITVTADVPKTHEEQINYLKTQVTKHQAENILAIYPNVVDDVINNIEIDYTKIKGVGEFTWNKIKKNILDNYVVSDVLVMLQPLGVTYDMITKLIANEPNPVLLKQKLIDNPYIMTKIKGFGFKKVDALALKINPKIVNSTHRLVAFIQYYLNYIGDNDGHSYVLETQLDKAIQDNVSECVENYNIFKKSQKSQSGLFLHFDDGKVGLTSQYELEMSIYNILKHLDSCNTTYDIDIEKGIKGAESEQGFQYTEEQRNEIYKACKSQVALITGKAGSGKSCLLRGLVNIYKNYNIGACALSAKAAIRITEATGLQSSTIHKMLQFRKTHFEYNSKHRLGYDIIILDEASMVSTNIFYALVSAIKEGAKVIIVGDDGQLPPIGCGNIFHDLLNLNDFTCCKLTKILRQAQQSGIISDSIKIRNGDNPLTEPKLKITTGVLQDMTYMFRENREGMRELAIKLFMSAIKQDSLDETIILTPCKQDRINSSFEINKIIQDKLIPKGEVSEIAYGKKVFRIGAKVIQRANDYDKSVFNGEIGYITDIKEEFHNNKKVKMVSIDFGNNKIVTFSQSELQNIELAYCLTCHLTQGSGFKNVIVLIDNTHYKLLDRCILYTAITRAKKKCALIAEPSAFKRCLNIKASCRNTWLSLIKINKNI